MFTLGIPKRDYRRATQVLGYESSEEITYDTTLQDDGFYLFSFPEVEDEYDFRKIANKLKSEGIRIIGADTQLTEKKIMKLADLITEDFSKNLDESESDSIIEALRDILKIWQRKQYVDDKSRWEAYYMDIEELVQDFEEERAMDTPAASDLPPISSKFTEPLAEQKVRKVIRKLIRQ
jgi:hypothetical protein